MQSINPISSSNPAQTLLQLEQLQQSLQNRTYLPPQQQPPSQPINLAALIPNQVHLMSCQGAPQAIAQTVFSPADSFQCGRLPFTPPSLSITPSLSGGLPTQVGIAPIPVFNDQQPTIYTYIPQQLYKIPFQLPVSPFTASQNPFTAIPPEQMALLQPSQSLLSPGAPSPGAVPSESAPLTKAQLDTLIEALTEKKESRAGEVHKEPVEKEAEVSEEETKPSKKKELEEEEEESRVKKKTKKPSSSELTDEEEKESEEDRFGQQVGDAVAQLMKSNPEWYDAIERSNLDDIIADPNILRKNLHRNKAAYFTLKHLPKQVVTALPDQMQPLAQQTVDWLREDITDKPLKEFHLRNFLPHLPGHKRKDNYDDF